MATSATLKNLLMFHIQPHLYQQSTTYAPCSSSQNILNAFIMSLLLPFAWQSVVQPQFDLCTLQDDIATPLKLPLFSKYFTSMLVIWSSYDFHYASTKRSKNYFTKAILHAPSLLLYFEHGKYYVISFQLYKICLRVV